MDVSEHNAAYDLGNGQTFFLGIAYNTGENSAGTCETDSELYEFTPTKGNCVDPLVMILNDCKKSL
jgi:hypothetical protein